MITEAGLSRIFSFRYFNYEIVDIEDKQKLFRSRINLQQLLILLTCGFFLSTLTFIVEVINLKLKKKQRVAAR